MHRYTLLRLLVLAFFLLLTGLVLYELDLHYYQAERNLYVRQELESGKYDRPFGSVRSRYLINQLVTAPEVDKERIQAALVEEALALLATDSPYYGIQVVRGTTGEAIIDIHDPDKQRRLDRFPNSLFLNNTSRRYNSYIPNGPTIVATIRADYTVPPDDPKIAKMTQRYMAIAVALVLAMLTPYVLIERLMLRPYAQVVIALESAAGEHPILRPVGSDLMRRYNDLARDAALRRLEQELLDPSFRSLADDEEQIAVQLPARLEHRLGYALVHAFSAVKSPDGWNLLPVPEDGAPTPDELMRHLNAEVAGIAPDAASEMLATHTGKAGRRHLCLSLRIPARADRRLVFTLGLPDEAAFGGADWEEETAQRVLASIDALLTHFSLLRDQLARERSEANVSLARNLGHDLTNAIATTKLDVGALGSMAGQGANSIAQAGRWEIFEETVESLRNNVSAMQEIVNIYRSFSYLRQPKFEQCAVGTLVAEVADVLLLSTSLDVEIEVPRTTEDDDVIAELEPRLLKLALFNLLTNALEALKRRDTLPADDAARAGASRPRLAIRAEADADLCRLVVEDNGTGFRDTDGALLSEAQLDRVFHLGFTTKSTDGEGLGLNWVWTIIHDIHGGTIRPEQVSPGGARFVIELPIVRDEPA